MPRAGQNCANSFAEYSAIESEAPVIYIFLVEADIAVEGRVQAACDLPQSRNPWSYIQAAKMFKIIVGIFTTRCRPWPDQAHLTFQDVPKLRNLIDTELAQVSTGTSNAGVVGDFEQDFVSFVQVAKGRL